MTVKTKIRKWLDIKDPIKPKDWGNALDKAVEKYRKEATIQFERIVKQMKPVACINDGKLLIEGRDAIYTNFKGQKFCSHKCIDEFAKPITKAKKGKK